MEFILPGAPQFKANLHCHSNLSDGRLTPEELVRAYRGQGYSWPSPTTRRPTTIRRSPGQIS